MKREKTDPINTNSEYDVKALEPDSPEPQKKQKNTTEFNPIGATLPSNASIVIENTAGYQEKNKIKTQNNFQLSLNVKNGSEKISKKKLPFEECFQVILNLANKNDALSLKLLKDKLLVHHRDVFVTTPRQATEKDLWECSSNWIYEYASIDMTGFQFLLCQNPENNPASIEKLEEIFKLITKYFSIEEVVKTSSVYPEKYQPILVDILFAKAVKNTNTEMIEILLRLKADINSVKYCDGYTPLSVAIRAGKLDVVTLLVNNGAKLDLLDDFESAALFYAAKNIIESERQNNKDLIEIFNFLLTKNASPDISVTDKLIGKTSLLSYLIVNSCQTVLDILLTHINRQSGLIDKLDSNGMTPLHVAVTSGNVHAVQVLIQYNANADILSTHGLNALQMAALELAKFGDMKTSVNTDIFELLLDKTTDPNQKFLQDHGLANKGWTILHLLVATNSIKPVEILLKHLKKKELSIDIEDDKDCTPLYYTLQIQNIYVARILLSYGANIKHKSINLNFSLGLIAPKPMLDNGELEQALITDQLFGEQVVLVASTSFVHEKQLKEQAEKIRILEKKLDELLSEEKKQITSPETRTLSQAELITKHRKHKRSHSDPDISQFEKSTVCKKIVFETPPSLTIKASTM